MNEPAIRLLYFVSSLSGGGAERIATQLVSDLAKRSFDPAIVALSGVGSDSYEISEDVPVHDLSHCSGWRNTLEGVSELRRLVGELQPDLVIGSLLDANGLLLRSLSFLPNRPPVVVTVQNNLTQKLETRPLWSRLIRSLEVRWLYDRADVVVAVSKGVKEDLVKNHGVAENRVVVVPNFVDVDAVAADAGDPVDLPWSAGDHTPVLVAAGRFEPQKAFDDLIEAFRVLQERQPSRLVLLGTGPLKKDIERLVLDYGLDDRVFMPGFVENPWGYFGASDLFVSTSKWEGFSLTHLEAMASGLPVVLTDCDYGPGELVDHGVNGILVPVGEPHAIAAGWEEVLTDHGRRARLQEAGRRTAERYDRSVIADRYEQLFRRLVREGSGPSGGVIGKTAQDSNESLPSSR